MLQRGWNEVAAHLEAGVSLYFQPCALAAALKGRQRPLKFRTIRP